MNTFKIIVVGFISGLAGAFVFYSYQQEKTARQQQAQYEAANYTPITPYQPTIIQPSEASSAGESVDFSFAATKATPSVVYINSISQGRSYNSWDWFFGSTGSQTQVSSGSGVIFSADGYIVTNNHVIETAEKIQVLYNKKQYDAELIGTDPSTDLAVLKIKESNLPAITLGNSKNLAVGEWVIAVGNPFSLSSTVTVGVVSAKGRKINIVDDRFPIESFIQTDAAINPGNSGGALVNKNGELVGINTAILSRTGSYTGYAFAVPIDIVKKAVEDLIKYGTPQKAIFGGKVVEHDFANARKYGLDENVKVFKGVIVGKIERNGAAAIAGLQEGDIITKINNTEINSESAFEEELAYHYPGDKITVSYLRGNKLASVSLTLLNKNGDTSVIKRTIYNDATLGVSLEAVDYGVKIFNIKDGLFKRIGLPENYTIIQINRRQVKNPSDVIEFFNSYKGRVYLYGINGSKQEMPLSFYLQ
ncbi:MAG: serine protease [Bacteroidota bacterium]|nr:MAG: protease Do [Bacteroidetes bacterium OLB12]GIL23337.1 MAG: serine protease [Bacteroidota bacterium]HNR73053.1 trypsin-like peptidase domain-containing protein [Cyclobacteriaceae bacterium]HNU41948.1 trypsin-like peptidase domain-containing protein [Cyclobacteriaceae bacterium]